MRNLVRGMIRKDVKEEEDLKNEAYLVSQIHWRELRALLHVRRGRVYSNTFEEN